MSSNCPSRRSGSPRSGLAGCSPRSRSTWSAPCCQRTGSGTGIVDLALLLLAPQPGAQLVGELARRRRPAGRRRGSRLSVAPGAGRRWRRAARSARPGLRSSAFASASTVLTRGSVRSPVSRPADGAHAQRGPLRQLVLGQPSPRPELPQQRTKLAPHLAPSGHPARSTLGVALPRTIARPGRTRSWQGRGGGPQVGPARMPADVDRESQAGSRSCGPTSLHEAGDTWSVHRTSRMRGR